MTSLGSNPSKERKVMFFPFNWLLELGSLTLWSSVWKHLLLTISACFFSIFFLPKVWKNIIFTRCSLQCCDPIEKCLCSAFHAKICICESVLMPHHYSYAKQTFHNPPWFRDGKRWIFKLLTAECSVLQGKHTGVRLKIYTNLFCIILLTIMGQFNFCL